MKIGIIGFGSMGMMLMHKFLESGSVFQKDLYVSTRTFEKLADIVPKYPNVNFCKTNEDVAKSCNIIFICVKPSEMKDVSDGIAPFVNNSQHISAVNACIRFDQLDSLFPECSTSIVIPSVTGEVNKSITLVSFNDKVKENEKKSIVALLGTFSSIVVIPEKELGISTDLASCMPGFIASIFDVIVEEALSRSTLSKEEIHRIIITTILGTAKLCVDQQMSFDQIVERVATKGGITEEGAKVIKTQFPKTIREVFQRTREKRERTIINEARHLYKK